jgi:hypothetical protein
MHVKIERLIQQLARGAEHIQTLAAGVSEEQARQRPDAASWSVLEVINHLYDEEREDFRVRLGIMLHRPQEPWPPIDPQRWVRDRHYNERELSSSLQAFLQEREQSLAWLRALDRPDWEAIYQAPFGPIHAGDMMAAWVAHDWMHIRQLVELHYAQVLDLTSPYNTHYAGVW